MDNQGKSTAGGGREGKILPRASAVLRGWFPLKISHFSV